MNTNRSITKLTATVMENIKSHGGTDAGAEWAFQTLDPFHDCELPNARGTPLGTGMSVVSQTIREQITIRKPATVLTTSWDCHIVLTPIISNLALIQGGLMEEGFGFATNLPSIQPFFCGDVAIQTTIAPLFVLSGPVGMNANAIPTGANQMTMQSLSPANVFINGGYRVSAQAFEVRSVGPDQYKSGTCNMWRIPVPALDTSIVASAKQYSATTLQCANFVSALVLDAWPSNELEATLIPSTLTGLAKDGCYIVARMNTIFPHIFDSNGTNFIFRTPSQPNQLTYSSGGPVGAAVLSALGPALFNVSNTFNGSTGFTTVMAHSAAVSQFDLCGAQFLGLSDSDVLTITVKWIITRYPTQRQPEILVCGKVAPTYDPVALRWYSQHVQLLPTGVPVKDNGLGDWFRSVVVKVGDFVKPLVPMASKALAMAGPKGKAIAATLSALTSEKKKVKEANKKIDNVQKELKIVKSQVNGNHNKKKGKNKLRIIKYKNE